MKSVFLIKNLSDHRFIHSLEKHFFFLKELNRDKSGRASWPENFGLYRRNDGSYWRDGTCGLLRELIHVFERAR